MADWRVPRSFRSITSCAIVALCCLLYGNFIIADDLPSVPSEVRSPISPEDSLLLFRLDPGLTIEIAAAEPDVVDPIAIAFNENSQYSQMWVVEMIDYPRGPNDGEAPMSRIRVLTDKDGYGRFREPRTFADKLLFVTGILPWKDGLIVTLAGRVAFMKDTDGDGKADVDETWFTGFAEENSQLRANHPTFGLDNRIYIANGLRGGNIIVAKDEWKARAQPLSISGRDFAFDPITGRCEAVSGIGQFGMTFDDFGNRFVCSNRNPCQHVVLEDKYLKRNPDLSVSAVMHDVSPPAENSRVYSLSKAWTTSTLHAGQFTAACGVTIYRGNLMPEYYGHSFTCEPTANLVHRDAIEPDGATFVAKPSQSTTEFLASPDEWFRPVNLANGREGELYVVDMYRAVIEHPDWVPDELKNRPDERYGDDRGRIYRIRPTDEVLKKRGFPPLRLSKWNDPVAGLELGDGYRRDTHARRIYESQDRSNVEDLEGLLRDCTVPEACVRALWALNGLGSLSDEVLLEVLRRQLHPRVVEHAVRLSEPRLKSNKLLQEAVVNLDRSRGDARLDFQFALSLGELAGDRNAAATLAMIGLDRAGDPWTRKAILSSVPGHAGLLFERVVNALTVRQNWDDEGVAALVEEIATLVGTAEDGKDVRDALDDIGFITLYYGVKSKPVARVLFRGMSGLGAGLARRGVSLADQLPDKSDPSRMPLDAINQRAIQVASAPDEAASFRNEAIAVLRYTRPFDAAAILQKLAVSEPDQNVRLAAIDVLAGANEPEVGKSLLAELSSQTPTIRRAILNALLQQDEYTRLVLSDVESGRIRPTEIDPARWSQLTKHKNTEISAQAKKLYDASQPADRQKVLADYQPAITLKGDAKRGRDVFAKNCTGCHRIGDLGVNVAPDIADSRTQNPSQLLTSILDPNRAVDNNYFSYTVVMLDGKIHTGIIGSETSSSITLRQQENKTLELLRRDIDEIHSNGVSLMPVGLEKNITVEQMADLIAFIKNWRYLDGSIPASIGK